MKSPWWPFSRRARRFAALQTAIVENAFALPGPSFLVFDENPQEYDVGGPWAHAGERTWSIPPDCDVDALLSRALSVGGWCIYTCPRALDASALPDAFGAEPAVVEAFALSHAVPFLAQAFHDSDPWRVFVENVPSQHRAAA